MPNKKNTRNPSGTGTIRKRSNGKWEVRYTAGYDTGIGKQIQKSIYGETQGEVSKKLRAIQTSQDAGTYIEPSKMTLSEWLDIWSNDYLSSVKNSTVYSYKKHIENHIKPALGAVKLQRLNLHDIQKLYNNLHKIKKLSPKTIKNLHGVLHSSLKQAVKIGYLFTNPSDSITLPRIINPKINPLPEFKISEFIKESEQDFYNIIFFVALFTGMRQGEVLGLTWDCINFKNKTILIEKQLQKDKITREYKLVSLKNDKPRTITPAPLVMQKIKEQKIKQMEWKLQAGSGWNNHYNLVFTNEIGHYLSSLTVYNHYKKIVAKIGYPKLRFHDLRHTYAINALQSGDDIKNPSRNFMTSHSRIYS